jgi:hypothetical protein
MSYGANVISRIRWSCRRVEDSSSMHVPAVFHHGSGEGVASRAGHASMGITKLAASAKGTTTHHTHQSFLERQQRHLARDSTPVFDQIMRVDMHSDTR